MQIRSSAQGLEKENIKVYRMIIPRFKYDFHVLII